MNWLKRLFKKKITGKELDELLLSLGKDKKFIRSLSAHEIDKPTTTPLAYLRVKKKPGYGVEFNLEIIKEYFYKSHPENKIYTNESPKTMNIRIPYRDLAKNPVLEKYVKKRNLESSLAVLSVASVLASTFFISNNITGNAILTNNANSSGIIGAGLFVLGVIGWVFARNI